MAKVEISGGVGEVADVAAPETPTQAAKPVLPPFHVEDARGRVLQWKKTGYLEQMRLAEIAGPNTSQIITWMLAAEAAYSVVSIDGDRIAKPVSKMQLEALVQRLGDEGMDALVRVLYPGMFTPRDEAEDATALSEVDRAKN